MVTPATYQYLRRINRTWQLAEGYELFRLELLTSIYSAFIGLTASYQESRSLDTVFRIVTDLAVEANRLCKVTLVF